MKKNLSLLLFYGLINFAYATTNLQTTTKEFIYDCSVEDSKVVSLGITKAIEKISKICGQNLIFHKVYSTKIGKIMSPDDDKVCSAKELIIKLGFNCLNDNFISVGISDIWYHASQQDAVENAKKICPGEILQLSDWTDKRFMEGYWHLFYSKAWFRCLR